MAVAWPRLSVDENTQWTCQQFQCPGPWAWAGTFSDDTGVLRKTCFNLDVYWLIFPTEELTEDWSQDWRRPNPKPKILSSPAGAGTPRSHFFDIYWRLFGIPSIYSFQRKHFVETGTKTMKCQKKSVRLWSVCSFTSRFLLVIIIIIFYFLFFSAAAMPKEAATKVNRLRMHNDNTHHTKNIGAHEEKKYVL